MNLANQKLALFSALVCYSKLHNLELTYITELCLYSRNLNIMNMIFSLNYEHIEHQTFAKKL